MQATMATEPELIFDGPQNAAQTIVLAHGAGAGMRSPFLQAFTVGLASLGFRVARFEFPYMAARRAGRRGPPDPPPVLRSTWLRVIESIGVNSLIIGGKSMGGRIASLIADEAGARGLVCLGYPFHPTGKPQTLRVEHLQTIRTPTLILQGTRDPFGNRDEVAQYRLSSAVHVHWLEDGDHSFKPRTRSGRTEQGNWREAMEHVSGFVGKLT
jgi:predicted alpha/beta-hydrolase family hydrolase